MMANNSSTEEQALKASTFQRLHPRAYFERFLSEGVRPDGREPNAWRDVSVNVGEQSLLLFFVIGPEG
jgi:exosome complex component RRP43